MRHRARDGGIRRRSKTLTPTSTGDSDGFARNTPSITTATIVPASLRLHQNANETVTFKRQSEIRSVCTKYLSMPLPFIFIRGIETGHGRVYVSILLAFFIHIVAAYSYMYFLSNPIRDAWQ